ncbi:MAG: glycosyltransferase [Gammaproteobacteria bacterium]
MLSEYWLIPGLLVWLGVWLAPWRPWRTDEQLEANADAAADLSDVTVLIPARNEAAVIETTLAALGHQGPGLSVLLVDDHSEDGTVARARALGLPNLRVLSGLPLPTGWTGKLWALEQGRVEVGTRYVMLLDADVRLGTGLVATLKRKLEDEQLHFVSLMVELRMRSLWERLLMPAFVYFFKLLYPFKLCNQRAHRFIAAAAGGCVLTETSVLAAIGGFAAIRAAVIDDCALAKAVKSQGFATWIGLTRSAQSLRGYSTLDSIWAMVSRSAFAQLRYSVTLLVACTAVLLWALCLPALGLFGPPTTTVLAGVILGIAMASYIPTLRYYRRSWLWSLAFPLIGLVYLAITWSSAIGHWRGAPPPWKGRRYGAAGGVERVS